MSSTQSFLRQRVVGTTLLTVDTSKLYVLQPTAANYVGNYPPGTMTAVGAGNVGGAPTPVVARDMGKTVVAAVTGNATAAPGAFRCVQLLSPVSVQYPTSVTNFGVQGSVPGSLPSGNTGDDGYNTFYVPIVAGGVIASGVTVAATVAPLLGNVF